MSELVRILFNQYENGELHIDDDNNVTFDDNALPALVGFIKDTMAMETIKAHHEAAKYEKLNRERMNRHIDTQDEQIDHVKAALNVYH